MWGAGNVAPVSNMEDRKNMTRILFVLIALAATTGAWTAPIAPLPRVFGTYSSWPQEGYRFRDVQTPLYATLGWACDSRENLQVAKLMADLDRYDMFVGPSLYNYDHAQPFEQYLDQWKAFLQRGGIIVAADENYGQMIGWVTRLGEGLELQSAQCPPGMKGEGAIKPVLPGDPACPPATCKTPWAHFSSVGKGWTVLARCSDGSPVCLRADIGKGVVIATNLYDDLGYPTPEYLDKLWQAQWPRLMDRGLQVEVDRGLGGVGRKAIGAKLGAAPTVTLRVESRQGDGPWQTQTVAPPAAGATASVPVTVRGGRNDLRVVLVADGQPRWWTSWAETPPDVPGRAEAAQLRLTGLAAFMQPLTADHPVRADAQALAGKLAAIAAEAGQLRGGEASTAADKRWQELDANVSELAPRLQLLAGRAIVAARAAQELKADRPFAVVRSGPLEKVFRDEVPAGALQGEVRLTAARGEGESAQVVVVPLRGDLAEVTARLEPFADGKGRKLVLDAELHRVGYVHLSSPSAGVAAGRDWWPDPLLSAAKPFAVKQLCQPLWLDLWTPRDAKAGRYCGALVVEAAGQTERVPLTLEVLDFALPKEHSLRQMFIFRAPQITQRYSGQADYKSATPVDTYLRMMDVCLKRRVGVQAFGWEGSPTPVSAMAYMGETKTAAGWQFDFTQADRIWQRQWDSGMRTLFVGNTPGCGSVYGATGKDEYWVFLEAYLKALVPHLKAKGWFDSAAWYMVDECWAEDAVQANLRVAELMDRVAPGLKRLMTAPRDARLYGKSHIWVPGGLPEASPNDATNKALLEGWKPFSPERWWYICCGPTHPYPNFFADYPAVDARVVFWLTWKYAKTGFLYWGVEYHGDPKEMTSDGPTEKYALGPANMGNGDGTLCYWGPNQEFYPSIRLNSIRDGIEDYEYCVLARKLADDAQKRGKAPQLVARTRKLLEVDERVLKLTDGSPNFAYSLDPANLLRARGELSECILALQAALGR